MESVDQRNNLSLVGHYVPTHRLPSCPPTKPNRFPSFSHDLIFSRFNPDFNSIDFRLPRIVARSIKSR